MQSIGKFFARVVVGVGLLQLVAGTIGLLIWGSQEVQKGVPGVRYFEKPNLSIALIALIPNLLISSIVISIGALIATRIAQPQQESDVRKEVDSLASAVGNVSESPLA